MQILSDIKCLKKSLICNTDVDGGAAVPDSEGGHGQVSVVVRERVQRQRSLGEQDALSNQPQVRFFKVFLSCHC